MKVMADNYRENLPTLGYVPHPHFTTSFCPDPDLGLTPERSPLQNCNKKSVRFVSPAKCRARRKVCYHIKYILIIQYRLVYAYLSWHSTISHNNLVLGG